MWGTNIRDVIRREITTEIWDEAQNAMVELHGYKDLANKKKNEMVIVATLHHLWNAGKKSAALEDLCQQILP
jgi:hypothetical protein